MLSNEYNNEIVYEIIAKSRRLRLLITISLLLIHLRSVQCGGGSQLWGTWAQTISMASCLISTPGNSANTDSIREAKERSYPWTNIISIWNYYPHPCTNFHLYLDIPALCTGDGECVAANTHCNTESGTCDCNEGFHADESSGECVSTGTANCISCYNHIGLNSLGIFLFLNHVYILN